MEYVWEKPVIVFYKERLEKPEAKTFAVAKARKLTVSTAEGKGGKFSGSIMDFFPLMGNIDYISSKKGKSDRYSVLVRG